MPFPIKRPDPVIYSDVTGRAGPVICSDLSSHIDPADRTALLRQIYNSQILLANLVISQHLRELRRSLRIFGEENDPFHRLIETIDHRQIRSPGRPCPPLYASLLALSGRKLIQKLIHQIHLPQFPRLRRHTGRFSYRYIIFRFSENSDHPVPLPRRLSRSILSLIRFR